VIWELRSSALAGRHPGLSAAVVGAMVEAGATCLARHGGPPTELPVTDGELHMVVSLQWSEPDAAARRAWADTARATEWGAEAVAVLAADRVRGLVVVDRAMRGSRVDFYLGRPGDVSLERAAALEVAGIDVGGIESLLAQKVRQAAMNPDRLPAIAAAVRFHDPRVMLSDVRRDE
jgi:hypothetical protein